MRVNDFVAGLVLAVFAAAVLFHIRTFPNIPGQNIGPAAFPGLIAALLLLCAVILMVRGWRARALAPWASVSTWVRSPEHLRNFGLTVAALVFFIVACETLGFIVCGLLILTLLFLSLRVRPQWCVPLASAVTLGIHAIFYMGLRVPLPWGVLEPLFLN